MLKFVDFPNYYPASDYEQALRRMTDKVSKYAGVRSIYQIGGVSTPGISDLDMVVVFEDGIKCLGNPLSDLSKMDRYFFCHAPFGVNTKQFDQASKYSLFHNYKHLHGEKLIDENWSPDNHGNPALKQQVALEYLVKMWISLSVSLKYRILKLRGFFLHVKAIKYDLDFLGVKKGELLDLTMELIKYRNELFTHQKSENYLNEKIPRFYSSLSTFIENTLQATTLYLPENKEYSLGKSIRFKANGQFGLKHQGIVLPFLPMVNPDLIIKANHRLNVFDFNIPASNSAIPNIVEAQFAWTKNNTQYQREMLPFFMTLNSSLNLN